MSPDNDEFVALLTAAQPVLYARVLALLPCRTAAADALQETNMVLWPVLCATSSLNQAPD